MLFARPVLLVLMLIAKDVLVLLRVQSALLALLALFAILVQQVMLLQHAQAV